MDITAQWATSNPVCFYEFPTEARVMTFVIHCIVNSFCHEIVGDIIVL